MKKWINFVIEWFLKLWRLALYIGGMVALILEIVGVLHDGGGLFIFFDCMICILLPRINDEVFDPLLKKDNKEN
jgi:hypothetical protein